MSTIAHDFFIATAVLRQVTARAGMVVVAMGMAACAPLSRQPVAADGVVPGAPTEVGAVVQPAADAGRAPAVGAPVVRKERPLSLANPAIHNEIPDARFGALAEVWSCGGRELVTGFQGRSLRVTAGAQKWDLPPVATSVAGGTYRERTAAGETSVWRVAATDQQPAKAQVTLDGDKLPTCRWVRALPLPFVAQGVGTKGTEQRWTLQADARQVTLRGDEELALRPLAPGEALAVGQPLPLADRADAPRIHVVHETCVDPVSKAAYPFKVSVWALGRMLPGCGGEPASLLVERHWALNALGARPLQPDVSMGAPAGALHIGFDAQGRFWGNGPCNLYTGRYKLAGTQLSIQALATTRKACLGGALALERELLDALNRTVSVQLSAGGELALLDAQGVTITAR